MAVQVLAREATFPYLPPAPRQPASTPHNDSKRALPGGHFPGSDILGKIGNPILPWPHYS
jgi:hypothetical protein